MTRFEKLLEFMTLYQREATRCEKSKHICASLIFPSFAPDPCHHKDWEVRGVKGVFGGYSHYI